MSCGAYEFLVQAEIANFQQRCEAGATVVLDCEWENDINDRELKALIQQVRPHKQGCGDPHAWQPIALPYCHNAYCTIPLFPLVPTDSIAIAVAIGLLSDVCQWSCAILISGSGARDDCRHLQSKV